MTSHKIDKEIQILYPIIKVLCDVGSVFPFELTVFPLFYFIPILFLPFFPF